MLQVDAWETTMEKKKEKQQEKRGCLLKTFFVMYILSGLLLILLAYLVSRVEQQELVARWGVIVIYVISCFVGGFLMGKWKGKKKFLWGMLAGLLYVAVLVGIAVAISGGAIPPVVFLITTIAICIGSGMLGGMLS